MPWEVKSQYEDKGRLEDREEIFKEAATLRKDREDEYAAHSTIVINFKKFNRRRMKNIKTQVIGGIFRRRPLAQEKEKSIYLGCTLTITGITRRGRASLARLSLTVLLLPFYGLLSIISFVFVKPCFLCVKNSSWFLLLLFYFIGPEL